MPHRLCDPASPYPVILSDSTPHRGTVHLSQVISHARFEVGEYTYASDFDPPAPGDWATRLAPYLFDFSQETLTIGRFCQIAHGVRFITASATHDVAGFTSYPIAHFDPDRPAVGQPDTRDTAIGHDVWLGHGAMVLPGARIGDGAIIGAGAVVRGEVPPYAIVTGNPGAVLRMRFPPDRIERLLALAWWHWPLDRIEAATDALLSDDLAALEACAPQAK